MKKSILLISNNNAYIKTTNPDKKIKISSKFFSIKFIPYNKILNNLLLFLQKNLSPSIFNEIYKYFVNEIKKYLKKNISSNNITNNVSFNKNKKELPNERNNKGGISEFCYKKEKNDKNKPLFKNKTKINLKKYIQPFINLSYSQKFRNDGLNSKEISSFSNYINSGNKIESYPTSLMDDKNISYILPGKNFHIKHIRKLNKIMKKNKTNNNSIRINKQNKNKNGNVFLNDNHNYNTIHTAIYQNENNKNKNKIAINNNKIKKLIKSGNLITPPPLKTSPNTQQKNENINSNRNKISVNTNMQNVKDIKNIKNAVVINNTFFNKYKNNYNFGFIPNSQKKIKIVNIKLKDKDKKGNMRIINPIQNSEEMLDKIKKSLDDENLKVMLNFSYENFLSKESERESKEYSIGD